MRTLHLATLLLSSLALLAGCASGSAEETQGADSALRARPMGNRPTVKKGDLEEDGYRCESIGMGGWECTKEGKPTYICERVGRTCMEKPLRWTGTAHPATQVVYQLGRVQARRESTLMMVERRFGAVDPDLRDWIEVADEATLDVIDDRLFEADDVDALFVGI